MAGPLLRVRRWRQSEGPSVRPCHLRGLPWAGYARDKAMRRPAVLLCVGITVVCAGGVVGERHRIGGPGVQEPGGGDVRARTRQEFAGAMAKVTPGLAEKDVLALLGKPDDVK